MWCKNDNIYGIYSLWRLILTIGSRRLTGVLVTLRKKENGRLKCPAKRTRTMLLHHVQSRTGNGACDTDDQRTLLFRPMPWLRREFPTEPNAGASASFCQDRRPVSHQALALTTDARGGIRTRKPLPARNTLFANTSKHLDGDADRSESGRCHVGTTVL